MRRKIAGFLSVVVLCTCMFAGQAYAETYEYDELNRVVKVIYDDGSYITYSYDKNGNIKSIKVYERETTKNTITKKPQETTKKLQETTKKSQETTKKPQETTEKSQETTKPQVTTKKEQETTQPQTTTKKQQNTTREERETTHPQTTTKKQQTTTKIEHGTTQPQATTKKQQSTTGEEQETTHPQTTTKKQQTTTKAERETTQPQATTKKQQTTTKTQRETARSQTTTAKQPATTKKQNTVIKEQETTAALSGDGNGKMQAAAGQNDRPKPIYKPEERIFGDIRAVYDTEGGIYSNIAKDNISTAGTAIPDDTVSGTNYNINSYLTDKIPAQSGLNKADKTPDKASSHKSGSDKSGSDKTGIISDNPANRYGRISKIQPGEKLKEKQNKQQSTHSFVQTAGNFILKQTGRMISGVIRMIEKAAALKNGH